MSITRAQLRKRLDTYKNKIQIPVEKDTSGGPTWKLVQATVKRVPAAILPQLDQIDMAYASQDKNDRIKIKIYLKGMTDSWRVIKLDPVKKYIAEHDAGGSKSRQSGLKGVLSSASAQKAELNRVGLCKLFLQQHEQLNKVMIGLRTPNDFDDLEGM